VDSGNDAVHIAGDQVVVRSVAAADLPALERVMACPGVRAWWWDFDIGKFAAELDDPDVVPLVIEHEGNVVGYMQFSEETSLQYHFASIDLSLHDDFQGRGLGRDAVRALARYLFDVRGHHRLTIDPALSNERAVRCYESVGFQRVGVMREYERAVDGTWHDGLFMELLASDLPEN
jgi:aminoglycoside 6'-N-acetyltransferase